MDRRLGGGLDAGSLLAIVAPPASQSEVLIDKLIEQRPSVYLTTVRTPEAVKAHIETHERRDVRFESVSGMPSTDDALLRALSDESTPATAEDNVLASTYDAICRVDDRPHVVVDPSNPLERTDRPDVYRGVLNRLAAQLRDTDGLGIVHCLTEDTPPELRDITLAMADVVWQLDIVSSMNEVEYQLRVPKNRGGAPILEGIPLVLETDVWVDDSRNL